MPLNLNLQGLSNIDNTSSAVDLAMTEFHNAIILNISSAFISYFDHTNKTCRVRASGLSVDFNGKKYEPDVFIICDRSKFNKRHTVYYGTPPLIVEVLSPSTYRLDIVDKLAAYSKTGVKEYWVISPTDEEIRIYLQIDGELQLKFYIHVHDSQYICEDQFTGVSYVVTDIPCSLFPKFKLSLYKIFSY